MPQSRPYEVALFWQKDFVGGVQYEWKGVGYTHTVVVCTISIYRRVKAWKNKKNYVFNEAASKDYLRINQGTKGCFLSFPTISDHS